MANLTAEQQYATVQKLYTDKLQQFVAENGAYPNRNQVYDLQNQIIKTNLYPAVEISYPAKDLVINSDNSVTINGSSVFSITTDTTHISASSISTVNNIISTAPPQNVNQIGIAVDQVTQNNTLTVNSVINSIKTAQQSYQTQLQNQSIQNTSNDSNNSAAHDNKGFRSKKPPTNNLPVTQNFATPSNSLSYIEDAARFSALLNINQVSQYNYGNPADLTQTAVNDVSKVFNNTLSGTVGQASSSIIGGGRSSAAGVTGTSSTAGGGSSGGGIKTNPLHDYANHTYKISIYAVPAAAVNKIYDGISPGSEGSLISNGAYFVLSDGGASSTQTNRSVFPNDLTIDNLMIETVVGNNRDTRGSDAIRITFDVIEPYTTNFLEQLYNVGQKVNPGGNWNNSFFVMKIEFLGYDNLGVPKNIPNTTKYIPFTFVNITMKITASGSTYSCEAIPAGAIGATMLDNTIPGHCELKAPTVEEIFNGPSGGSDPLKVKSLKDYINTLENLKYGQNDTQNKVNKYEFEFDPAIGKSSIVSYANVIKTFSVGSVPTPDGSDKNTKDKGRQGSITLDFDTMMFKVQGGTRITDLIHSVVQNSAYMVEQYEKGNASNNGKPVQLIKITPMVKFGEWDTQLNYYQRTVKFYVSVYNKRGYDMPGFGQQQVQKNDIVKQYDYIFTGQSKDIISLDIDYKMAFFDVKNGVPSNATKASKEQTTDIDFTRKPPYDSSKDNRVFKSSFMNTTGLAHRQNTGQTTASDATIAVNDLISKVLDNAADMIQADMTIVGDPDWFGQDFMLYTPKSGSTTSAKWGSGSINFYNPKFFNLLFYTPSTDYNNTTGLFGNGAYHKFSGLYEVITVQNNFRNGKFTQKLTNVRVRNQNSATSSAMRSDTTSGGASKSNSPAGVR